MPTATAIPAVIGTPPPATQTAAAILPVARTPTEEARVPTVVEELPAAGGGGGTGRGATAIAIAAAMLILLGVPLLLVGMGRGPQQQDH